MILQSTIDAVNQRTDIVEVIGQFLQLKRRGINYLANCPFHNERTPSFNVNPARGIFKCFGCGKGGNAVTFVQEYEKLNYPEAIKWLADFYKIPIEETERSQEQLAQQQAEEGLRVVAEFAAGWFAETLQTTEEGQAIGLSYYKHRGIRTEAIETFRLGYCPESGHALYDAAVAKGYKTQLLEQLGLVRNRDGRYYDVYRGRVVFPIQGMTGRVIGFGARLLKANDRAPKYINSPENELYHKSRTLYGLYQARSAIGRVDECLLVEGYTDVISLHQSGVENVVASSGTSLTEEQLQLIGRLTKNVTILYDGDAAGIKAALRGLDMALESGFNVQLVLLPEGADPDSFVQAKGTDAFRTFIVENKRDVIGFRLEAGLKEAGNDPVLRSKLANEIAQSISRFTRPEDFTLRDHYLKTAATGLNVDMEGLNTLVNKHIRERIEGDDRKKNVVQTAQPIPEAAPVPSEATGQASTSQTAEEAQEWKLIGILLEHGGELAEETFTTAQVIEDRVDPELIVSPQVRQLFDEYLAAYRQRGGAPDLRAFVNHADPVLRQKVAGLLHPNDIVSVNWEEKYGIFIQQGPQRIPMEVESCLQYFELKKLKNMETILLQMLEGTTDLQTILETQAAYMQLKKEEKEIMQRHGTVILKTGL
ncbi:MAG: DNA primase [Sphingobacteriales bacterium]|nr:MAG: DNA primase [Sphingobacteriales bacterium]